MCVQNWKFVVLPAPEIVGGYNTALVLSLWCIKQGTGHGHELANKKNSCWQVPIISDLGLIA